MEFPTTRAILQGMREDNIMIRSITNYISKMVEHTVVHTTEFRYVYSISSPLSKKSIERIVESLRERFVDCDVIAGRTYIYVDWY